MLDAFPNFASIENIAFGYLDHASQYDIMMQLIGRLPSVRLQGLTFQTSCHVTTTAGDACALLDKTLVKMSTVILRIELVLYEGDGCEATCEELRKMLPHLSSRNQLQCAGVDSEFGSIPNPFVIDGRLQ